MIENLDLMTDDHNILITLNKLDRTSIQSSHLSDTLIDNDKEAHNFSSNKVTA